MKQLTRVRPLLAWRSSDGRFTSGLRALFALDLKQPVLVGGWYLGLAIDEKRAHQLWAAHQWQLVDPPEDVVALLANHRSAQWPALTNRLTTPSNRN